MSVEVRIPTILRTFTGGAKAVHGTGATLQQVLDDIEARNPGLKDRIVESETLRRFVNVYVNDEDVRFVARRAVALRGTLAPQGARRPRHAWSFHFTGRRTSASRAR